MKLSEYLILIIFILVFVGSLSLGLWQIDRGYDKKALENIFSQRQSLPVETNPGMLNKDLYYRNIQISGFFGKNIFFVDNKLLDGKAGFVVFVPFTTPGNKKILVSRGWIESSDRNSIPELSLPERKLNIDGMIRPFSKDFVLNDEAKKIETNFIIQGLDKELMENLSGEKFLPYVFELSALSELSLEPIWKPVSMKAVRHFGYAVQWFALSLVVLFGGAYLFTKRNK